MSKLSLILVTALLSITACTKCTDEQKATNSTTEVETEDTGLKIDDIQVGTGKEAQSGQTVTVHYTGRFLDGKTFDSSVDRKQPFSFTLGMGQVIKGWDMGVLGMKEGGKRQLTIPPELAYGKRGAGSVIPPNSTLKFDVELISVR